LSILQLLYIPCDGIFEVDKSVSIEVFTQKMLMKTQATGEQCKILQVDYSVVVDIGILVLLLKTPDMLDSQ
jgi:hypothetical protein